MPTIMIVAGPNGAGKTTFGNELRQLQRRQFTYINADDIELQLRVGAVEGSGVALAAARIALQGINQATAANENVMFETTLAVRSYARKIPVWRQMGYSVAIVYIRLPTADHAIERVRQRVANRGHDIPEETILRRFALSLEYFDTLYKSIVDEWYVWDSLDGDFVPAEAWDLP